MKRKLLILGFILSIAINIGFLSALAFHRLIREKIGFPHWVKKPAIFFLHVKLDLSEAQVKEIDPLVSSFMDNMNIINKKLREKKAELFTLLKESEPDRKNIDRKLLEITSLQGELRKIIFNSILQMKGILTPEQQKKFFSFLSRKIDFNIQK